MLFGQVAVGFCVSLTVTVNEQLAGLLDASVTLQVTVVTPFWNVVPDAGVQTGVPTPGQLSVAVAFVYVTTALHADGSVACATGAGQVITGACVSVSGTVNVQLPTLLEVS